MDEALLNIEVLHNFFASFILRNKRMLATTLI